MEWRESQGCSAGVGAPLESVMGSKVEPGLESGVGSRSVHGVMRYESDTHAAVKSRVPGLRLRGQW